VFGYRLLARTYRGLLILRQVHLERRHIPHGENHLRHGTLICPATTFTIESIGVAGYSDRSEQLSPGNARRLSLDTLQPKHKAAVSLDVIQR